MLPQAPIYLAPIETQSQKARLKGAAQAYSDFIECGITEPTPAISSLIAQAADLDTKDHRH